jgi:hypothetical protein
MKLLITTAIVLVIPAFFAFVFTLSAVSRLTSLRNRCRDLRGRLVGAPGAQLREALSVAAGQYNAARRKFPLNVVAALGGFREEKSPAQH